MYVQVNIGRNVGTEPMSAQRWQDFQQDVISSLNGFQLYLDYKAPAITYEIHSATGTWDGIEEESAHISTLVDTSKSEGRPLANAFTHLNKDLRDIAARYDQEAIALISGSKLLKV